MAALSGAAVVQEAHAATAEVPPMRTMLTSKGFNSTFAGLVFPYQPFDPSLGQLKRVTVMGQTVFAATGTAYQFGEGAYYPIQMQFDISVHSPTGEGMSFIGPWTYYANNVIGPGGETNVASFPVAYAGAQAFSFTIDDAADASGLATMQWMAPALGTAASPVAAQANFDTFQSAGGGVGSLVNITPIVTPSAVVMDLPTLGGSMMVQYDYIPAQPEPNSVDDGQFDNGLGDWTATGPGHATVVTENVGPGNTAAQLTTGSPITLSQLIDTPAESFRVEFDYAFTTADGTLDVVLDSQTLDTLTSTLPADLSGDQFASFQHFSIDVTDPSLMGLTDAELALAFDGPTGSQILIDNVWVSPYTAVPEPATLGLLAIGGMMLLGRRQRA